MYNITRQKLLETCYSPAVYNRGVRYYKNGNVVYVDIDRQSEHVNAVVIGSDEYSVDLHFSEDEELIEAYCDCPAFSSYAGYCKHVIAVLLYLKDLDTKPSADGAHHNRVDNVDYGSSIISFFENRSVPISREPIDIEITLEMLKERSYDKTLKPALSLRMGTDRLYVVRNMKELIETIKSGQSLEFGKQFTYDPLNNYFKEEDRSFLRFLIEMYDIEQTVGENMRYVYKNSPGLFKGKYLYLSDTSVARLLTIRRDRGINVNIRDKKYIDIPIVERELPANFTLEELEDDLLLRADLPLDIVPLTKDGEYIFLDGIIYNAPSAQLDTLMPFYTVIVDAGKAEIVFSREESDRFASFVMPNIKKAANLEIDKGVEKLFYQRPLDAKLYLDKIESNITVEFKFTYGEYDIDPFANTHEGNSKKIIIRDNDREREILDVIERYAFRINQDMIYLDDDDKIYEFIVQGIPELQELCEVYYTEAFKNMKLYNSSYFDTSIQLNETSDLLEFSFSIDGIDRDELPNIFASLKEKKRYYRLPDGSYIPLDTPELEGIWNMMDYLDLDEEDLREDIISLPKFKAMYLDDKLKETDSIYVERDLAFKQLVENIKEPRDIDYTIPRELEGILRGYQITGFKWLKTLASYGLGGILADDMGLGKTLQMIAFLQSEKETLNIPSIVICPTSLVYNWESEVEKFAPSLKTLVVSGDKDYREELIEKVEEVDIVITSYPLIRRDIDGYSDIEFAYCVLDEAQHIKNPNSVNAKSVKEIRARGYFALTGTPIENNLTELWSIFDFLMPGYLLSHKKFSERFERPIVMDEDRDVLRELNRHIKPFILRRLKRDVLKELPPKIESLRTVDLTHEQKKVYLAYHQQIKSQVEEDIAHNGFERSRIQILAGLTRLRQICCHPSLFIENYSGGSGKMDALMEMLQELKESNHRVLLFSQFTGVLNLIKEQLDTTDISYFYLDGSTKAEDRRDMVRSFNEGFRDVFLISLKAGGTGLNLTGADTVIHFDPWWNPAVEDQATDRAHRIGQDETVHVIKLINKGTIEEKIYELQQKKKELIDSVLHPGETFISKMTEEDVRDLFNISL